MPEGTEETTTRPVRRHHRLRNWLIALVLTPIVLVLAAVCSLYVPGVLQAVGSYVFPKLEPTLGMSIRTGNIRLRFPLRLEVDDALVINSATADTMITARQALVTVSPLPLLKGDIDVTRAEILQGFYQMGAADSLYVGVRVDSIGAVARMNFQKGVIDVGHADLNGARVRLIMGPDTTTTPKDTTATSPLLITTGPVTMANVDFGMYMALSNDTIGARLTDAYLSGGQLLVADTIDIKSGRLRAALASGIYAKRGVKPAPGLDFEHIVISNASALVDSFRMHGTDLVVPLQALNLTESCGLAMSANGLFAMTGNRLEAHDFTVQAGQTKLQLDADVRMDSVIERSRVNLQATAEVLKGDITRAFPAYIPLLAPLPANKPMSLTVNASGTMQDLAVEKLAASMPGVFRLSGSGTASNLSDPKRLTANVNLDGALQNPAPVNSLLPKGSGIKIPAMTLRGHAKVNGSNYEANLQATAGGGRLALDGWLRGNAPNYNAKLQLNSFPIQAFMPSLGVGPVTASLSASGSGFDPMKRGARMSVDAKVQLSLIHISEPTRPY